MGASKTLRLPLLLSTILAGLMLAAFSLLVLADNAHATTLDVCSTGCPYTTIQAAIRAAADGDLIRVVQGTYTGTMSTSGISPTITATIILTKNITLLGGYNDARNEQKPDKFITRIDGRQSIYPVVAILGSQAKVDGFYIINGRAPAGSGVWVGEQPGQVTQAIISHNMIAYNRVPSSSPAGGGAGILVDGPAQVTITQNRIMTNTLEAANSSGSGIGVRNGATASIEGNTIAFNRTQAAGTSGAGIYIASATVTILGNTIQENQDGGIQVWNSPSAVIASNTISKNNAPLGAGIWIAGSTSFTVTGNVVSDNDSYSLGGAGLLVQGGNGQVFDNSIFDNQAVQGGGGIAISGPVGNIVVRKNQILMNSAGFGGGVLLSSLEGVQSSVILTGNDIRGNMTTNASSQAGGVQIQTLADRPVLLVNNVITGSQGRGIKGVDSGGVTIANNTILNSSVGLEFSDSSIPPATMLPVTITNNIIAGHTECGARALNEAILPVSYSVFWNNGTTSCNTWTGGRNRQGDPKFLNPFYNDFHLRIGSAALSAGTPFNAASYDKDGIYRPQGYQYDAGAYELLVYQAGLPLVRR